MCPIVYRGGAMNTLNSSGNFRGKASPSYCHASLREGRSLNDTKHFRNLHFATTSYGCFTPKLGEKLLQTASNKSRKLTFSKSTLADKNSALKYFYAIFPCIKIEK